jgi:hypothetical protein
MGKAVPVADDAVNVLGESISKKKMVMGEILQGK